MKPSIPTLPPDHNVVRLHQKLTDADLIQAAKEYRECVIDSQHCQHLHDIGFLSMHFMICEPLAGNLSFLGCEAWFVSGKVALPDGSEGHHGWLKLPDGRVLDPLGDSFNEVEGFRKLPAIYLGKPTEIHQKENKPARRK